MQMPCERTSCQRVLANEAVTQPSIQTTQPENITGRVPKMRRRALIAGAVIRAAAKLQPPTKAYEMSEVPGKMLLFR